MFYRDDELNRAMTDAEREHAKQFRDHFGGALIDLARRSRQDTSAPRDHLSAEQRLRNGRCINCED